MPGSINSCLIRRWCLCNAHTIVSSISTGSNTAVYIVIEVVSISDVCCVAMCRCAEIGRALAHRAGGPEFKSQTINYKLDITWRSTLYDKIKTG